MSQDELIAQTLDDLGAVPVVVTVERPDGRKVAVRLRALGEQAMWDLRRSVTWPKPPVKDMTKSGPVYDYGDEGYQRAVGEANRELGARMLLVSLELAVPGETEAERLAALQRGLGNYAFDALVDAVRRINLIGEEEIARVAASFRAEGDGGGAGDAGLGIDAGGVAGDGAGGAVGASGAPGAA